MGLVAHLSRIANNARIHLERVVLRDEGLRWTAFDALTVICARRQVEVRALAAELGIAKPTLSELAGGLVARGLVRRVTPSNDRRRVLLCPTLAGVALVDRVQARVRAEEIRLLTGGSPATNLAGALAALAAHARRTADEFRASSTAR